MTVSQVASGKAYVRGHSIRLAVGEGLVEARRRWEGGTGRRGLVFIR